MLWESSLTFPVITKICAMTLRTQCKTIEIYALYSFVLEPGLNLAKFGWAVLAKNMNRICIWTLLTFTEELRFKF